jgi:hypothetical protein
MGRNVELDLRELWVVAYDDLPDVVASDFVHRDVDAGPPNTQRDDPDPIIRWDDDVADLTVLDVRNSDGSAPPTAQRRRIGVAIAAAAAAAIVVVVGLVVIDENRDSAVTEPVLEPSMIDSFTWSRVPDDLAGVRADGGWFMPSVVAGGPGFVAVGGAPEGAAVWTSTDGASWSRVPHDDAIFASGSMSSVIVGGPGLIAVGAEESEDGSMDAAVWTSPDGVTWSSVSHDEAVFGGPGDQWMSDVTLGGPGLVVVGHETTTRGAHRSHPAVWTSADGVIWSRVPPSDSVPRGDREQFMTAVTAGGPGLVAVGGGDGDATIPTVWTSPDGINWSEVPGQAAFAGGSGGYPQISSVTTGGPGLVAVGWIDYQAAVWTSPDGVAWSRVPHDDSIFGESWTSMSEVIDVGSGLIAVGVSNGHAAVWTSPDGAVWSRVPHDETLFGAPISPDQLEQGSDFGVRFGMTAVAAGPSGLVAVGSEGPANTAPDDGIVWIATPGK